MKKNYKCEKCGKTVTVSDGSVPDCCGKSMKQLPLDVCTQPANAEYSRPMEHDEPCDDGRAG